MDLSLQIRNLQKRKQKKKCITPWLVRSDAGKHSLIRRERSEQPVAAHSNALWSGLGSPLFSPRGLNLRGLTYIGEMISTWARRTSLLKFFDWSRNKKLLLVNGSKSFTRPVGFSAAGEAATLGSALQLLQVQTCNERNAGCRCKGEWDFNMCGFESWGPSSPVSLRERLRCRQGHLAAYLIA